MHKWRTTRRTRRTHNYVRDCTCAVAQLACVCMMVADSTETYMKKHTSVRQRTLQCSRSCLKTNAKDLHHQTVNGYGEMRVRRCVCMGLASTRNEHALSCGSNGEIRSSNDCPLEQGSQRKTTPSCRLGGSTKQKPCKTERATTKSIVWPGTAKKIKHTELKTTQCCHSAHDTHLSVKIRAFVFRHSPQQQNVCPRQLASDTPHGDLHPGKTCVSQLRVPASLLRRAVVADVMDIPCVARQYRRLPR